MANRAAVEPRSGTSRIPPWILLFLAGTVSATLCTAPPFDGEFRVLYVGAAYGSVIGIYFIATRGLRVIARVGALVLASTAAWPIALFGSLRAVGFIPGATWHNDPKFPLLFFGGVLGGIALLTPTVLLFRPASATARSAFAKALLGVLFSGIVGGIAWEPALGEAIWKLIPMAHNRQAESYGITSLFFVWQPLVAFFIGWATSGNRTRQSSQ